MYVCVYVCMHVRMYALVCVCLHAFMYACMHACMCVHVLMSVCMHISTCVCSYVVMQLHIHECASTTNLHVCDCKNLKCPYKLQIEILSIWQIPGLGSFDLYVQSCPRSNQAFNSRAWNVLLSNGCCLSFCVLKIERHALADALSDTKTQRAIPPAPNFFVLRVHGDLKLCTCPLN